MTTPRVTGAMTICKECGMPCEPNEYHSFAVCLMFKGCHNSKVVRDNFQSMRKHIIAERQADKGDAVTQLPDSIRIPLDEVIADLDYLFSRVAVDGSFALAATKSVRAKLDDVRSNTLTALSSLQEPNK